MPNEVPPGQEPKPNGQEPTVPQDTKPPEPPKGDDIEAMKARLAHFENESKSRGQEAQGLRKRLRELEAEKKTREEQALVAAGKHQELAEQRGKDLEATRTELEQLRGKLSTYEAKEQQEQETRRAQVAAEFSQLPDAIRSGIPADDLRAQEIAVNAYRAAKGQAPRPPTTPHTAPKPPDPPAPAVPENDIALAAQTLGNPYASQDAKRAARAVLEKAKTARR